MQQAIDPRLIQQLGGMGNLMDMMKQMGEIEQQETGGGGPARKGPTTSAPAGMPDMNAMQAMM